MNIWRKLLGVKKPLLKLRKKLKKRGFAILLVTVILSLAFTAAALGIRAVMPDRAAPDNAENAGQVKSEPASDGLAGSIASILSGIRSSDQAAGTKKIILKVDSPDMTVNGNKLEIDPGRGTKPVIINGRTLVPIRAIVNEMGGTIAWDGPWQEIIIYANNKTIRMHLNSLDADICSNSDTKWTRKKLDVAPKSINGRTMVPLRFVSEQLGAKINWNGTTKTITITFSAKTFNPKQWTGAWETSEGIIVFNQSSSSVKSTFYTDSLGKIAARAGGNQLNGTFYVDEVLRGDITLTLSADGKSFTGKYLYKQLKDSYYRKNEWKTITGKRTFK